MWEKACSPDGRNETSVYIKITLTSWTEYRLVSFPNPILNTHFTCQNLNETYYLWVKVQQPALEDYSLISYSNYLSLFWYKTVGNWVCDIKFADVLESYKVCRLLRLLIRSTSVRVHFRIHFHPIIFCLVCLYILTREIHALNTMFVMLHNFLWFIEVPKQKNRVSLKISK